MAADRNKDTDSIYIPDIGFADGTVGKLSAVSWKAARIHRSIREYACHEGNLQLGQK